MTEVIYLTFLGSKLRELREKRGWSQRYVANKLNMKQSSTYANWEYGLRDPDTDMLSKLADLFEVGTDDLLGRIKKGNETSIPQSSIDKIIKKIESESGEKIGDDPILLESIESHLKMYVKLLQEKSDKK